LAPVYTMGSHRAVLASATIPIGQGVSGWAAEANRPIVNGNPAVEFCYSTISCPPVALASALAIPLPGFNTSGGVLTLYAAGENTYRNEDLELLSRFTSDLASYLEMSPTGAVAAGVIQPPALPVTSVLVN